MSFGSSSIGVSYEDKIINVLCNKKCVRISKTHEIYLEDVKKI
jgi:hypothetical protein